MAAILWTGFAGNVELGSRLEEKKNEDEGAVMGRLPVMIFVCTLPLVFT
jgi:hypothetical protein